MKRPLALLIVALALNACTVEVQSHSTVYTADDRAMAVCGLGVIDTADGRKPAISQMNLPPEAYKTYAECVKTLVARDNSQSQEGASK